MRVRCLQICFSWPNTKPWLQRWLGVSGALFLGNMTQGDELLRPRDNFSASVRLLLQPTAISYKTYSVQGIAALYSRKDAKKLLESVLGKESCIQIHSLAASSYDLRENVATVTIDASSSLSRRF
jgi:hypothetical protein